MATAEYTGAEQDGDFSNALSWTGGTGASGVPAINDDVLIRVPVGEISSNANAFAAINVGTVRITSNANPNVTDSNAIEFAVVTDIDYGGSGKEFSFKCTTCATARIKRTGHGVFVFNGGTYTDVDCAMGTRWEKASAAIITNMIDAGDGHEGRSGTGYTTFDKEAGSTVIRSDVATLKINQGAHITALDQAAITTSATVYGGGSMDDRSTGTMALIETKPGAAYRLTGLRDNKTITNHTPHSGSVLHTKAPGVTVTLTNPATDRGNPLGDAA